MTIGPTENVTPSNTTTITQIAMPTYTFWFGPALVDAAACGDLRDLNKLLKKGEDVNGLNRIGQAALSVACQYAHIEVVKALLRDPETDVNLQDQDGETALMKAVDLGHVQVVKALLTRRDLDLNLVDENGMTALMMCKGKVKLIKDLLKAKADPNVQDVDGWTLLMHACAKGRVKAVQELLKRPNVDLQLMSNDNQTALDLATEKEYARVIDLLQAKLKKSGKARARPGPKKTKKQRSKRERKEKTTTECKPDPDSRSPSPNVEAKPEEKRPVGVNNPTPSTSIPAGAKKTQNSIAKSDIPTPRKKDHSPWTNTHKTALAAPTIALAIGVLINLAL